MIREVEMKVLDIHCHILPHVDDGASDIAESIEMARLASSQGITHIAATPHFHSGRDNIEKFLQRREKAVEEFRKELHKENIPIKIIPAAEVAISYGMHKLRNFERLCYGNTKNILLECRKEAFPIWFESEIKEIKNAGFTPILAHAEFVSSLSSDMDRLKNLVDDGLFIQINAMSVTSPFYTSYGRLCKKIIKEGLAHFIATDAHNMKSRLPEITRALERVKKWNGSELYDTASVLFADELNE